MQCKILLHSCHIRLDPLKLSRDPLKVVGSARDLLKILTNGSPAFTPKYLAVWI